MRRGFTLVEAGIALALVGGLGFAGYIFLGRKIVDDGDATKSATAAGFTEAKVITRHSFFASQYGCAATDDLAFDVKAKDVAGNAANIKVCCGAWYKGCAVRTK